MKSGTMMNTNATCSAIAGRPFAVSALWHSSRVSFRTIISRPREHMVTRAGLLDFLTPVTGKTLKKPARTAELVEELLELTRGTEAGIKASSRRKEQIEDIVDKLSAYCMRSPLRSDLIFGEWEVVYASKPTTAGGPFRSPIGRAIFLGQRATQVIAEPNICINEVSYKALGFVPGSARQEGEIEPINGTTFQITFPGQVGKKDGAVGGPPTRLIEVAYLDDRIRVAKALPQKEGDEGSFYVFVRTDGEEDTEEDYEEAAAITAPTREQKSRARAASVAVDNGSDNDGEDARPRGALTLPSFDFSSFQKPAGSATQAERSVAARGGQANQNRGSGRSKTQSGTQIRGEGRIAIAPAAAAQRKAREELAAERAAVKAAADEKRREAAAAASTARAQAEEDRRRVREEAAEERRRAQAAARAEREAAQQRKRAARESFQELTAAANEAASNAKDAATAYKSAGKKASSNVKAAAQARNIISEAVAAAERAASELEEGQDEEIYLKKEVLSDQRLVNKLEKKLRKVSAAIAPRIS